MQFKTWLESKGIRLTDEIDQKIDEIMPQLHQMAVQAKQSGEELGWDSDLTTTVQFTDKYSGRPRQVNITVINDPGEETEGDFNPVNGVTLNVAHVELSEITPRWVRRTLVHELGIHANDPKIADFDTYNKMGARTYQKGGTEYYTQPIEFDAYTGQIIDSLLKAAKMNRGTQNAPRIGKMIDDTLVFLRNPQAAATQQIYGIIGDKDYWRTFNLYYARSTPQQKRQMYQRIYHAAMDAKQILGA